MNIMDLKYKPHITIMYDCGLIDIDNLKIPDFKLKIGKEYLKDLNLN